MRRASGPLKPVPGEQREDVFERPQGAAGPEPERGGQRPGDQQRHDVRVGEGEAAVVAGDGAQLGEGGLGDAVEQGCLVRGVPVEDHRIPVQPGGEAAHGQGLCAVTVDDLQRGAQDEVTGDLAVPAGAAALDGAAGWRWGLWSASASRRLIILLGTIVDLQC
jgi:hypothetical protein